MLKPSGSSLLQGAEGSLGSYLMTGSLVGLVRTCQKAWVKVARPEVAP